MSLSSENGLLGETALTLERPDVARSRNGQVIDKCGWSFVVRTAFPKSLVLKALDGHRRQLSECSLKGTQIESFSVDTFKKKNKSGGKNR